MFQQFYTGAPYASTGTSNATAVDLTTQLELATVQLVVRPVAAWARQPVNVNPAGPPVPVAAPHPMRVLAQDIRTKEWLHTELPLSNVSVQPTLSGASVISGELVPNRESLVDLGFDAWATWLHVEEAGEIAASGILQPLSLDISEETLSVEATGFAAYPDGIPYWGEFSEEDIDAWEAVTEIWRHLQSYPDGDLGVIVDPGETGYRLGVDREQTADEDEQGDIIPYELLWWDNTDCGQEIDSLAGEAPFDFVERSYWNADRTAVEHHLVLWSGRRRTDLRFAQGENLMEAVSPAEPDNVYASQVVVLGSGEGSERIRGQHAKRHSRRVRRVRVVDDKAIGKKKRARSRAHEVWSRAQSSLVEFAEIVVDAKHENAKLGTFSVGDTIPVGPVEIPYVGAVTVWHRIESYTYEPEGELVRMSLSREQAHRG